MKFSEIVLVTNNKVSETKWIRMARKKGIKGVRICPITDHLSLEENLIPVKNSILKENKATCIFSDYTKLRSASLFIPEPPKDWDLIFLGGDPQVVKEHINSDWARVSIRGAYSYIVRDTIAKDLLNWAKEFKGTIHDFYQFVTEKDSIKTYYLKHCIAVDLINPFIKHLEDSPESLQKIELTNELDPLNLPHVNLITFTKDNNPMFPLTIRSFYKQNYPRHLITWVILDSSSSPDKSVKDLLPDNDSRIKYLDNVSKVVPQSKNAIMDFVTKSDRTLILHFDENTYYPRDSIQQRVHFLVNVPNGSLVGSTKVPYYDLTAKVSYTSKQADINDHPIIPNWGSLSYDLQFWEQRRFTEKSKGNNVLEFIKDRYNLIYDSSDHLYFYSLSAFGENLPDSLINKDLNYYNLWDFETQEFINVITETL